MKKYILTIVVLIALFLNSCKESPKQENTETSTNQTIEKTTDEIVVSSAKDDKGNSLEMSFNNTKYDATLFFNGGEQIDLEGQRTGSGIWYKNDHYELRGKGEHLALTKDGKIIFKN